MADLQLKSKLLQLFKGSNPEVVEEIVPPLSRVPAERLLFLTTLGAGLVGLSMRTAVEFFRVAPEVGSLLNTFELQAWGECGKRLAATNVEAAHEFFTASPVVLGTLPKPYRLRAITLCTRQATLSTRVAVDTFKLVPSVVSALGDTPTLQRVFSIANDVARHSVKHSHDLIHHAERVIRRIESVDTPDGALMARILDITAAFVHRSGGTAADFFINLPEIVSENTRPHLPRVLDNTQTFLERSGGLALHFLRSAGGLLAVSGIDVYEQWLRLALTMCVQGNANSYQFLKLTPEVVQALGVDRTPKQTEAALGAVFAAVAEITRYNQHSALECYKSSASALRRVSVEQFRAWAMAGIERHGKDARAAQAYYGLQTRASREMLDSGGRGLTLESVTSVLRMYVEGLTGRTLAIAPLVTAADHARLGDGRTIFLPSLVSDFDNADANFRLYKVLAAHGAGQIEFGTYAEDTPGLLAIQAELFDEFSSAPRKRKNVDFSVILLHFPDAGLATSIFTTLENGRIDRRLRRAYRGIRRDLDFVRERLRASRPDLHSLPVAMQWRELLFQIAFCGGCDDDTRRDFNAMIHVLEHIVADHLDGPDADVADALQATRKVYALTQNQKLEVEAASIDATQEQSSDSETSASSGGEPEAGESQDASPAAPKTPPPGESFNTWAAERPDSPPPLQDIFSGKGRDDGTSEQKLEPGDKTFLYDEWDRELGDYRVGWCRIIERCPTSGSRTFVETTRSRHRGLISSIRHQFQLMKPEHLRRVTGELDGEEFDLEAAIQNAIDRKAAGVTNERLYIKRLRRQRDVAVAFLLDMSSSTARVMSKHPSMPYTRPGQRIIDIEKEGLVLMNEALEAVGDRYAIYGFTSEGRRNVRFYVIKEFEERYDAEIERRIGGVNYQNNTRLGTAVRHAATKLAAQDARTKLLILLSDGRPYDHDYGDARYAREDTKSALRHAQTQGITAFCITIEREAEAELKELYGEVGFTVIDDVLSLPERLPGIYRRLTT
jgi:nitric oxide reductase NorD protein